MLVASDLKTGFSSSALYRTDGAQHVNVKRIPVEKIRCRMNKNTIFLFKGF